MAVIGAAGLGLLKDSEGVRFTPYLDPVGIPTVCYGHTGRDIVWNKRYSPQECDALLMQDIAYHQTFIIGPDNCIKNSPLNQNQLDAVTSFTFNVGGPKFCASTMAKRLSARDYAGASKEFAKWNKARVKGKAVVLPGLAKRRTAEKSLFDTPTPVPASRPSTGALRAIFGAFK